MTPNPGALARLEAAATERVQPRVLVESADLRTALAALASAQAARVRAEEALRVCRDRFADYSDQHRAKAQRNDQMVEMCAAVLSGQMGPYPSSPLEEIIKALGAPDPDETRY